MTKSYQKMSVGDALYTAARKYPGSVEALAQRLGKSPAVLRAKLAPDVDTHHTSLEEALQVIELLDVTLPYAADQAINAIGYRLGRVIRRHSGVDTSADSLEIQALTLASQCGKLCADMATTRTLTRKQADTLTSDIAVLLTTLYSLKDAIDYKRDHPAPSMMEVTTPCAHCSLSEHLTPDSRVLPDASTLRVRKGSGNRK